MLDPKVFHDFAASLYKHCGAPERRGAHYGNLCIKEIKLQQRIINSSRGEEKMGIFM
jgi:hypothetical protein